MFTCVLNHEPPRKPSSDNNPFFFLKNILVAIIIMEYNRCNNLNHNINIII